MTWVLLLGLAVVFGSFTLIPKWVAEGRGNRAVAELSAEDQADFFYACRVFDHAYEDGFSDGMTAVFSVYFAACLLPTFAGLGYLVYLGVEAVA